MNPGGGFDDGFLWGAATSAHQIEGSPLADGAGPSNWYRFSHQPGRTHRGQTADVACDHYRRWEEDVERMRWLGLSSYRFSISWSRVLPEGTGPVNRAGLDFYDRLVDRLLEFGIQPMVTLYHWDLPAALEDRGGWLSPDAENWFADYAALLFGALDDRVPRWATLNEPWVIVDAGHVHGTHAPGHRSLEEAARVSVNLLRAHAAAVRAYRALGRHEIGLVVNLEPKEPATDDPADVAACQRADAYMNRAYLDPVILGSHPPELPEVYGPAWSAVAEEDLTPLTEPLDFLGINYYTRAVVRHDDSALPARAAPVRQPGALYTETDWEVHPSSLAKVLRWVHERYGPIPLYVTENGAAFADPPTASGATVGDPLRVEYFREHLRALRRARAEGVDLRGYFAWSLLDNYEWSHGYSKRFGLFHVDYRTQGRTPKASAEYYRRVIASGGAALDEE